MGLPSPSRNLAAAARLPTFRPESKGIETTSTRVSATRFNRSSLLSTMYLLKKSEPAGEPCIYRSAAGTHDRSPFSGYVPWIELRPSQSMFAYRGMLRQ
jgi:hypothetical protein